MKLLLDEMHTPLIADALEGEGWSVGSVAGEASLRGSPDAEGAPAIEAQCDGCGGHGTRASGRSPSGPTA